MDPVEILKVLTEFHDGKEYVTEIVGSPELLAKAGESWPGIKQTVREPVMLSLALPELGGEDEAKNQTADRPN